MELEDKLVNTSLQVLVEGCSADTPVPRQSMRLSECLISNMKVEGLNRGSRHGTLLKAWTESDIDNKWKETNWFKKRQQIERRDNLTDFDRFKVMRLKKQRRFEERRVLHKIRTTAKA